MHELYELKEKLCDELKDYGTKEVTASNLEVIDKLAHATKNIDKIIEAYEGDGYSGRMYPDGMGGSYGYSRNDMGDNRNMRSYARGRTNARRDSMGRYSGRGYSRAGDLADQLHDMMQDAPNENIKREMQRLAEKIEQQM